MSCRGSGWKAPALTALASPGICARRACQCWRWTARTGGARRAQGKSDPIDAYAAARAALSGTRAVVPKSGDGIVEAIRALRVARRGAVKARTQTTNQLKSLLVTAPPEVRERVQDLKTPALVQACARLRSNGPLSDPAQALKVASCPSRLTPLSTTCQGSRERSPAVIRLSILVQGGA